MGSCTASWAASSRWIRSLNLGWREELDAAGAETIGIGVPIGGPEHHYRAGRELLDRPHRPTAVLCFSDVMATDVVRAAEDLGLRVPEDLSVVGFDDSPVALQMRPTLTTVRQDFSEKGRLAATLLIEALAQASAPARARHRLLPTELVVRESTAPPPAPQP